ncbi:MAG: hypothetical protein LIP23_09320, partial [Planctomycetes bacterium]|nr:hypothetical protein [Planctomycetota bacterium]
LSAGTAVARLIEKQPFDQKNTSTAIRGEVFFISHSANVLLISNIGKNIRSIICEINFKNTCSTI